MVIEEPDHCNSDYQSIDRSLHTPIRAVILKYHIKIK